MINTTVSPFNHVYTRPTSSTLQVSTRPNSESLAIPSNIIRNSDELRASDSQTDLSRKVEALEHSEAQTRSHSPVYTFNSENTARSSLYQHTDISAEEIRTAEPIGFDPQSYKALQTFTAIQEFEPTTSLVDVFV